MDALADTSTRQQSLLDQQTTITVGAVTQEKINAAAEAIEKQIAALRKDMDNRFDTVDKNQKRAMDKLNEIRQAQIDAASGMTDAEKQFNSLTSRWTTSQANVKRNKARIGDAQTRFGKNATNSSGWDKNNDGDVAVPEVLNMFQDLAATTNQGVSLVAAYSKLWVSGRGKVTRGQLEAAATAPDDFNWGEFGKEDTLSPGDFMKLLTGAANAQCDVTSSNAKELVKKVWPGADRTMGKWNTLMKELEPELAQFLNDNSAPWKRHVNAIIEVINNVKAACAMFAEVYNSAKEVKDACLKVIVDVGKAAGEAAEGNFIGALCSGVEAVVDTVNCVNKILKLVREVKELTHMMTQSVGSLFHDSKALVDDVAADLKHAYGLFKSAADRAKHWVSQPLSNAETLDTHLHVMVSISNVTAPLRHTAALTGDVNVVAAAYSQIVPESLELVQLHLRDLTRDPDVSAYASIALASQHALSSVRRAADEGTSGMHMVNVRKLVAHTQGSGRFVCTGKDAAASPSLCLWGTNLPPGNASKENLRPLLNKIVLQQQLNTMQGFAIAADLLDLLHRMDAKFRFQTLQAPDSMDAQQVYDNLRDSITSIGQASDLSSTVQAARETQKNLAEAWARSMDYMAFPPNSALFGYTVSRTSNPTFFKSLELNNNASLNIPLPSDSIFARVRVVDMDVSAYLLPSPADRARSGWPETIQTQIEKGPTSAFNIPLSSDERGVTARHWVHPNINGDHSGRGRHYRGRDCHNLDDVASDGNKYLFPSPYGLWSVWSDLPVHDIKKSQAVRIVFKVQYDLLKPFDQAVGPSPQWADHGDMLSLHEAGADKDAWSCTIPTNPPPAPPSPSPSPSPEPNPKPAAAPVDSDLPKWAMPLIIMAGIVVVVAVLARAHAKKRRGEKKRHTSYNAPLLQNAAAEGANKGDYGGVTRMDRETAANTINEVYQLHPSHDGFIKRTRSHEAESGGYYTDPAL